MSAPLRVALAGAAGRMGRACLNLLPDRPAGDGLALVLGQALGNPASARAGEDSGLVAGLAENGCPLDTAPDAGAFELLIDFAPPAAFDAHLAFCLKHNKALLIGGTGLSEEQLEAMAAAAADIPILHAPNTSLGFNLCAGLAARAARVLADSDVEILEAHHRDKADAPSGAALQLGRRIAEARGQSLEETAVYTRHGRPGARESGSIGFAVLRGGAIAGEHSVFFLGDDEQLELRHRVTDRRVFAQGALTAAAWLGARHREGACGLFGMAQVLGLGDE